MQKLYSLSLVLLLFLLSAFEGNQNQYPGTNLRGRILSVNVNQQQFPLVSAEVEIYYFDAYANQWRVLTRTLTDAYGFFFLQRVPVGFYTIQVNRLKNYNIQVIMIDYNMFQYQDLPIFYY